MSPSANNYISDILF